MRRLLAFAVVSLALALSAGTAKAAAITGGTTVVTFNQTLVDFVTDNAITPSAVGTANLSLPDITFPITGGSFDTGLIEHDGSGLSLARNLGGVDFVLSLENFLIDTNAPNISGVVTLNGLPIGGAPLPLFELAPSGTVPGSLDVAVSATAAAAITGLLGAPILEGTVIGTAVTSPVPLPAAAWLFLSAIAAVFGWRKLQSRSGATA